jgi:predicted metal-dependent hydrolase
MKLVKNSIVYGTKTIDFTVEYRIRKSMEISVEPPNIVKVVAPQDTSEEVVLQKVKNKAAWIVQRLFLFKDMEYRKIEREMVNGESLMYLGRNYSLQLIIDPKIKQPEVKLFHGKFFITAADKNEDSIRASLEKWYRGKTLEKVTELVSYYQHYFKKKPAAIKVKEQQKRWASCTSKEELLFNWRCAMAPFPVLDYIVVHEMCHMYHMNHSQDFWDLLATIMPDYEPRKVWLRNFGVRMDL